MPLSNIWVPRRDSRGLFVPKRPHTALPNGDLTSVSQQWANWIYPVPTRGIYWSGVDQIGVNGLYGGTADRTPTPYGLGISTPDTWEFGGPGISAGSFSIPRQTHFSVFYLYDATKIITSGRYPSLGTNRSRDTAPSSIDEVGLIWSNQSGEQSIIATTYNVTFGGTNASVTGVGNGLHCAIATYTVNGNVELYLDGVSVATGTTGTYGGSSVVRPNFYWGGIGPANQNVGVILLAGVIYTQAFTAAEVQAFTANPFGYFFVDAPKRKPYVSAITYSYSRPSADSTPLQWSRQPSSGTHFSAIDETSSDPSDYLYALSTGLVDTMTCGSVSLPATGTSILVNYTSQASSASQIKIELLEGSTVIKSANVNNLSGTITITSAEWASVTSWPWTPTLKITSQ